MRGHVGTVAAAALVAALMASSAARAENYAILFSGGANPEENYERYYNQTLRQYKICVNKWGFKPENVYVLFSDGTDDAPDQSDDIDPTTVPWNSDWSYVLSRGSTVVEATGGNLQSRLSALRMTGPHELVYLYTFDHGSGDEDEPDTHDEEALTGWQDTDIADDALASWWDPGWAGRKAAAFFQCYSGGMLEELAIATGTHLQWGMAATNHYEKGWYDTVHTTVAEAYNDSGESGTTRVFDLFLDAYTGAPYFCDDGMGPGGTVGWMTQHPWQRGANFDIAVARWAGAGAGGAGTLWADMGNWGDHKPDDAMRSVVVELTSAATLLVDNVFANGGYLSLDWPAAVGDAACLRVTGAAAELRCKVLVVGDTRYGRLEHVGGEVRMSPVPSNDGAYRVILGFADAAEGVYVMTGGELWAERGIDVGYDGMGRFSQSGGYVYGGTDISLASMRPAVSEGHYDISGVGTEILAHNIYVGGAGVGYFAQGTGTLVTVSDDLVLSRSGLARGTYTMDGGSLDAGGITVAAMGWAQFTMGGGYVRADRLTVGDAGEGTMDQTDGSIEVHGEVALGVQSTGDGTYALGPHGALSAQVETIGAAGTGAFVQTGGTNAVIDGLAQFILGHSSSGQGTYDLQDGLLRATVSIVGLQGTGTLTQSGGTHTVDLDLKVGATGTGTYELSDGAVSAPTVAVGHIGTGTMEQTGGTCTVATELVLGVDGAGTGTYELGGGAVSAPAIRVGAAGKGTFVHTDGTCTVAGELVLGANATGDGTYRMEGGLLDVRHGVIRLGPAGAGQFDLQGGTVIADRIECGPGGSLATSADGGTVRTNALTGFADPPCFVGHLQVGHGGGPASGSLSVPGGKTLEVRKDLVVGYDAPGELEQAATGSAVRVLRDVYLGYLAGTNAGTYVLRGHGNALQARDLYVGYLGRGEVFHGDSTCTLSGNLCMGFADDGTPFDSTYDLEDGGVLEAENETIGVGTRAVFGHTDGSNTVRDTLRLGGGPAGDGRYGLTAGTVQAGNLCVGVAGRAQFTQDGGQATVTGLLSIGHEATGEGDYLLNAGLLLANGVSVGHQGMGSLTQNGGVHTASGVLCVGRDPGSSGVYALVDGNLEAYDLYVGHEGEGEFIQDGGTTAVGWEVRVGAYSGTGSYELNGGTLTAASIGVGHGGTGTFSQKETSTVTGTVLVGCLNGSHGTYDLWNGQMTGFTQTIGIWGTGTFNHYSGANTVTSLLQVGEGVGGRGIYNLEGGTLTAGTLAVGNGTGTDGTVNWNGGTLDAALIEVRPGGTLNVKNGWTWGGTLSVLGGALEMAAGLDLDAPGPGAQLVLAGGSAHMLQLYAGVSGRGTVAQSGGTCTVDLELRLGDDAGAEGVYLLDNGKLNVGTLRVGGGGTGRFEMDAGSTVNAGTVDLNPTGTFTRTAGTLGYATFHHAGGTFNGNLVNEGTYDYDGGVFNGRLVNYGTVLWGTDFEAADGMFNAGAADVPSGVTVALGGLGLTVADTTMALAGDLETTAAVIGHGLGATFVQAPGSTQVVSDALHLGEEAGVSGVFRMEGGDLEAADLHVGHAGVGTFEQLGGRVRVTNRLVLGHLPLSGGEFSVSGKVTAADLVVGGEGIGLLRVTDAGASIAVTRSLQFGPGARFIAPPGTEIHLAGAALENRSTTPAPLADLEHAALLFEGGPGVVDPLEVAGRDAGLVAAAWPDNFAVGTVAVGTAWAEGHVELVDAVRNVSPDAEALYVGNLALRPGATLATGGLSLYVFEALANQGTIDLAAGRLLVAYDGASPFDAIAAQLKSGLWHGPGGYWDGPGIQSSVAADKTQNLDRCTAIGTIDNLDPQPKVGGLEKWDDVPVRKEAVFARFTWWGDANLDGVVDTNDYDLIDRTWLMGPDAGGLRWAIGDFNYDGLLNTNDYDLIDRVWLLHRGEVLSTGGPPPLATPEPATLGLLVLGGLGALLGRRRK